MMPDPFNWPKSQLPPIDVSFHMAVPSRSGGMSITGQEQVVVSNAGFWRAKASFIVLRKRYTDRRQILWRTIMGRLQGRSNTFLFGPCERGNSPAGLQGETSAPSVPHYDEALFDDETGYDQTLTPAHVDGAVAIGDTTLFMVMEAGHSPEPGQYFSVGQRLFLIHAAEETETADRWLLTFWPPSRAVMADQAVADFDNPRCLMRLANDQTGELSIRHHMPSQVSLEMVEAF